MNMPVSTRRDRSVAAFDPATSRACFRIGLSHSVDFEALASILRRLHLEAPHAEVLVSCHVSEDLPALMVSGRISLGIGYNIRARPNIRVAPLAMLSLKVLRTDRMPYAIDYPGFCARLHVAVGDAEDLTRLVDRAMHTSGYARRISLAVPHYGCLTTVLPGTDLIAIVPDAVADRVVAQGGFRADPLPMVSSDLKLSMAWSVEYDEPPADRWLRLRIGIMGKAGGNQ